MTALWRMEGDGERRWACGEGEARRLLDPAFSLAGWLAGGGPAPREVAAGPPVAGVDWTVCAPLDEQPVWAAGVTFHRSREARMKEATDADIYDRVYDAERPELFFKAEAGCVRGPLQPIGVRADSAWSVPEPELAVVADAGGRIVAATVGNDVSARDIEGENPLYLPQAKVYEGSCAVGPCLLPIADAEALAGMEVAMEIVRDGAPVYTGEMRLSEMKRTPHELVDWLFRAHSFPRGVVLLTGTSLVPPDAFTLAEGDEVRISITAIGTLVNPVERVPSVASSEVPA